MMKNRRWILLEIPPRVSKEPPGGFYTLILSAQQSWSDGSEDPDHALQDRTVGRHSDSLTLLLPVQLRTEQLVVGSP